MLGAGLVSQFVADSLHAPRMLVLLGAGSLLGPSVAGAIDVPPSSTGAQLLLTLGVSFVLFHGGLQLSTRILGRVAVGLGLLVVPGVILTAVVTGLVAAAVFGLPLSTGLPDRRRARTHRSRDPDPAVRADPAAPEDLTDDHRRVGVERPDRCRPRARLCRCRPQREHLDDQAADRTSSSTSRSRPRSASSSASFSRRPSRAGAPASGASRRRLP